MLDRQKRSGFEGTLTPPRFMGRIAVGLCSDAVRPPPCSLASLFSPLKNSKGELHWRKAMTPDVTNQLTAGLLLLTLGSVLAILVVFVSLVVRCVRENREAGVPQSLTKATMGSSTRQTHPSAGFDSLCRWAAIKSSSLAAVQSALELHNPTPCAWSDGISKLSDQTLFISPPIHGWILLIGQGLPDPAEDVDECFRFVLKLSRTLGQVQFFSVNRAVNHHAWVRAGDGRVQRAYAWAGETLWNQGTITRAEIDLKLRCFAYAESAIASAYSNKEPHHLNAYKVNLLAARWSIDPNAVDENVLPGISGELIYSRQH